MTHIEFNGGRPATKMGGDAIAPHFDVERGAVGIVLDVLRSHGAHFRVVSAVSRVPSMELSAGMIDRVYVDSGNIRAIEVDVLCAVIASRPKPILSLLHRACISGQEEMLSQGLRDGEDPNGRECLRGFTPLHYLIENSRSGGPRLLMMEELVKSGANVRLVSNDGESLLDVGRREQAPKDLLERLRYWMGR